MISLTENDRKNETMGENRESGQYRPLHWDVLYFDGNTFLLESFQFDQILVIFWN